MREELLLVSIESIQSFHIDSSRVESVVLLVLWAETECPVV